MTNPKYLPHDRDGRLFKMIEEMGEVLAALGKAGRHGMSSYNPELPAEERETNAAWIWRELDDLEQAIAAVRPDIQAELTFIALKDPTP